MAVIIGQKTGVIQTPEYSTTLEPKGQGGSTGTSYFAWTLAEANTKINELSALGWQCSLTQDGPGYRINTTFNVNIDQNPPEQPVEPTSQWSLVKQLDTDNLLESDRAIIKQLTTKTKELIRTRLKKPDSIIPIVEYEKLNDEQYIKDAVRVYSLMLIGITGKKIFIKTLKRTITVTDNYNSTWLQDSEGKVITTPTMITRYDIPAAVSVLMPNPAPSVVTTNAADNDPTNLVKLQYGWLDMGTDRQFSSNNNIQISQEWQYGKWPFDMYDIM